jgi:hypothetical protein
MVSEAETLILPSGTSRIIFESPKVAGYNNTKWMSTPARQSEKKNFSKTTRLENQLSDAIA